MVKGRAMTEEERAVEAGAYAFLDLHLPKIMQDYLSENGNVLDADRAKEHFEVFARDRESRIRWASAVYGPAARLVDLMFRAMITEARDAFVVFLGGGPGSGKTSFCAEAEYRRVLQEAAVVMDGTLADYERSEAQIKSALELGHQVVVFLSIARFGRLLTG